MRASSRKHAVHYERTAQIIEAWYRDRLEEQYPALAHHYNRSHNTEKTVA
jgi:hypothetical protein